MADDQPVQPTLRTLATYFLRLGATAFGGPLAHMAIMDEELVERKRWMSRQSFSNLLAAANLIPGPTSTELAIHVGYLQRGALGAIVAGTCFILPAAVIMLLLGWLYVSYGDLPALEGFFYGLKAATIAVIAITVYRLAQTTLKLWLPIALAVAALALTLWRSGDQLYWMLLAGVIGLLVEAGRGGAKSLLLPLLALLKPAALVAQPASLIAVLLVFLKVGATLFGSGLVVVPLLQAEVVAPGWISNQQLLDGVALAQATPGPVLTIATFIGYLIAGVPGAVVATVGIFLPAFIFVLTTAPLIERLRDNRWLKAFLGAVAAAVVGTIAAATILLAQPVLFDPFRNPVFVDWLAIAIATVSLVAAYRKVNTAWVVIGAGLVGLLISLF